MAKVPDFDKHTDYLDEIHENARKEGYIYRQAPTWKKNYFVLIDKQLKYYRNNKNMKNPMGKIPLDVYQNIYEKEDDDEIFFIENYDKNNKNSKIYRLKCDSAEERQEWINAIQEEITSINLGNNDN
eukprot:TRINITY_DN6681_c0_g1_i1.p1 TRINITY_DN6681_c0_g1~~TRINITY_DN6681_c0_g1_i1.p1  ORF type:complete len:127 (+),score=42.41 TRINITY_DN6681_c0_g1_i1:76-456(+)